MCVDSPLPHLDRPFDYLVPESAATTAQPGTRVRVRFAGQLVDGYLLSRAASSSHEGKLSFLERVVSPERVLTPEVARLAREIADRYAGTLSDVLRLAVPPRHAKTETTAGPPAEPAAAPPAEPASAPLAGPAPAPPGPAAPDSPPSTGPASAAPPASASTDSTFTAPAEPGGAGSVSASAVPAEPGTAGSVSAAPAEPGSTESGSAGPATASDIPEISEMSVTGSAGSAGVRGFDVRVDPAGWVRYAAGAALLRALGNGRMARAVWTALPGEDWPARLAEAAATALAAGRGSLIVVADARDLDRLDAALRRVLGGPGHHVALSAALGPAERYRRFLAACRGTARIVIGTRAASFAPVAGLGLVAIWDDGDDLHSEPRAPYPHARQVLLARAELEGCAAIVGGFGRTTEAQQLVETGWAIEVAATRAELRRRMPRVLTVGEHEQGRDPQAAAARLPSIAWRAARDALAGAAPVLVQVPRRGYLPAVSCADCYTPSRCIHCSGPLALPAAAGVPVCRWCGRPAAGHTCPECGGRRLRAAVVGARRTAEELARAFPDTPVRTSGRDEILASVPSEPALVVATPGAEPLATGGYGAVLLLDTWAFLTRADLRGTEEALRRWFAAAALARPAAPVVVVADGGLAAVQALLRFDPAWLAARELADRRDLGFPPAARIAALTGAPTAVAELLSLASLPPGAEVLGPVPAAEEGQERMLVRTARSSGKALALALKAAAGARSVRRAPDPVRIQIDPLEL
ncbi:primosomal protein N' [Dactylosporangium sp. CA-092794]|uniref:primosomal protein N' n=1 Tax=Dactylosporangium sp. CA-092794 TaxID=3239929 RepID=UPI003D8D5871